jgi:predicted solute-binding protein
MEEHLRRLDYSLGCENLRGLRRFFELASRHGIIPSPPELKFAGGGK